MDNAVNVAFILMCLMVATWLGVSVAATIYDYFKRDE